MTLATSHNTTNENKSCRYPHQFIILWITLTCVIILLTATRQLTWSKPQVLRVEQHHPEFLCKGKPLSSSSMVKQTSSVHIKGMQTNRRSFSKRRKRLLASSNLHLYSFIPRASPTRSVTKLANNTRGPLHTSRQLLSAGQCREEKSVHNYRSLSRFL